MDTPCQDSLLTSPVQLLKGETTKLATFATYVTRTTFAHKDSTSCFPFLDAAELQQYVCSKQKRRHTASRLAEEGARVIVHGRRETAVNEAVEFVKGNGKGQRVEGVVADLSSLRGMNHLCDEVLARTDRLDCLLNNAGERGVGLARCVIANPTRNRCFLERCGAIEREIDRRREGERRSMGDGVVMGACRGTCMLCLVVRRPRVQGSCHVYR